MMPRAMAARAVVAGGDHARIAGRRRRDTENAERDHGREESRKDRGHDAGEREGDRFADDGEGDDPQRTVAVIACPANGARSATTPESTSVANESLLARVAGFRDELTEQKRRRYRR